jgi:hypothetical protein
MYEQALLLIYAKYYSSYAEAPTREDIVSSLVDLLQAKPELRSPDESLEAADAGDSKASLNAYARRAVNHLEDCGWFEVNKSGYRVLMEFSPVALPLMHSFLKINDGSVLRLEGVMRTLRDILDKLASGQEGYASSIDQCAMHLHEVCSSMRGTRTKLLTIRSTMFKIRGATDRFRYLFDKYVTEIFPHDITHLMSDRHPYRFQHQTLAVLDSFKTQKDKMRQIGYDLASDLFPQRLHSESAEERLAAVEEGIERAHQGFARITSALSDIQEVAKSIFSIKTKVDRQLEIQGMMRTSHRRGDPQRLEQLMSDLGQRLATKESSRDQAGVPMTIIDRANHLSQAGLRAPNVRRKPVSGTVTQQVDDPLSLFRNSLNDEYLARIAPADDRLVDFLDRALSGRERCECDDGAIRDIDDFIMASALVKMIIADEMPPMIEQRYRLVCRDEWDLVETRYARFPRFEIMKATEMRNAA